MSKFTNCNFKKESGIQDFKKESEIQDCKKTTETRFKSTGNLLFHYI